MNNFWLDRAENREALQALETERTIEKILNNYVVYTTIGLLENFECSNTLDIDLSYTLNMDTCDFWPVQHNCGYVYTDAEIADMDKLTQLHVNLQPERIQQKFQQELERIEAEGWVLDV